ncbi:MAG: hypothetical protein YFSK_1630 [Candidatus Yanofskyibacterium parasiticum]|jgi:predicted negative regulator of RcsB-dependent stress response|nr:MAG: hypothetical protein YFSK_1630 [Candidatus Yanofskybacteria bacterium]
MKNFLANNWFKLAIIVIAALTIAGYFYWYAWRPNEIKQQCYTEAEFDKNSVLELDTAARQKLINNYYQDCLLRFGIK